MDDIHAEFLLERLIRSKTWAETKRFLELNPVLLSGQMDQFIIAKLAGNDPEGGLHEALIDHQQLLALCRQEGLDSAFHILLEPTDPRVLAGRLFEMVLVDDPVRYLLLCRRILAMIVLPEAAGLEAFLRFKCGCCLVISPFGGRGENLEQARVQFQRALKTRTRAAAPEDWAKTVIQLAWIYRFRGRGDFVENNEKSIDCFEEVLTLWSKTSHPRRWAVTTAHLALAVFHRVCGDREQNIERAISLFNQALEVLNTQTMSEEWGSANNYLALVYTHRVAGDREENIEKAIGLCGQALTVRTREASPAHWGETTAFLADAWRMRKKGNSAENLDRAVTLYETTLEIKAKLFTPSTRAYSQNGLALAYRDRINGDRAQNQERAIECWQEALKVSSLTNNPFEWAGMTQDLSAVYVDRLQGDRRQNIEQAIEGLKRAVRIRTRQKTPANWAAAMSALAHAYSERIAGNRVENLEQAIGFREAALEVFTRESLPEQWADTISQLGLHYLNRAKGDHQQNLERAVTCWQRALEVQSVARDLESWAETMNHLGGGFFAKKTGNRRQNLEQARTLFERALAAVRFEEHPGLWAQINANLANIFRFRLEGKKSDNLKQAVLLLRRSLEILTWRNHKSDRVTCMNNLAEIFVNEPTGDSVENLEKAIELYEQVLSRLDPDNDLRLWAGTKTFLGSVLLVRLQGNRAENVERAIELGEQVRRQLTASDAEKGKTDHLQTWIRATVMTAEAFRNRPRGDSLVNREKAYGLLKQCHEQMQELGPASNPSLWLNVDQKLTALCITWEGKGHTQKKEEGLEICQAARARLNREGEPHDWALMTRYLADAFNFRYHGNRGENFERAIELYHVSLEIITRETNPVLWAETLTYLAGSYRDRREGDKPDNHLKSIGYYRQASEVFTVDIHPRKHHMVQGNLGRLLFFEGHWEPAYRAFQKMLRAGECLFETAPTQEARRAVLKQNLDLPARCAYCLARMGKAEEAVITLERYRTRTLGEILELGEGLEQAADHPQWPRLQAARRRIQQLEIELRALPDNNQETYLQLSEQMAAAREDLTEATNTVRESHPDIGEAFTFDDIRSLVNLVNRPLVYLGVPWIGGMALIIPPGVDPLNNEHVVWLDEVFGPDLRSLLGNYEEDQEKIGYLQAITEGKSQVIKNVLADIWPTLQQQIMAPLIEHLVKMGFHEAYLIPLGFLGLLPIHVMGQDRMTFAQIPSARLLQSTLKGFSAEADVVPSLVAVANPTGQSPLKYAEPEVSVLADCFPPNNRRLFFGEEARTENVFRTNGTTHFHFACHGIYYPEKPLESKLSLAGEDNLTTKDLLDGFARFDETRLVFLSACQTGITDFRSAPDETVGLPAGFLLAGASGVISSLWPVDDLATSLLVIKFYQNYFKGDPALKAGPMPPLKALSRAQEWLQNLSLDDFFEFKNESESRGQSGSLLPLPPKIVNAAINQFGLDEPGSKKPYGNPYYWASFIYTGL